MRAQTAVHLRKNVRPFSVILCLIQYPSNLISVLGHTSGVRFPSSKMPALSRRVLTTDPPHIEVVLEKYAHLEPKPVNLALGTSWFDPPSSALQIIEDGVLAERDTHRYNSVLGITPLREALCKRLEDRLKLDLTNQELMVSAGANQAFSLIALALLDSGDKAILPRPYYFSHLCSLQLAAAIVEMVDWDPATLLPNMEQMREKISSPGVKMVVLTTPGNPSGAVCPKHTIIEIVQLCRQYNVWLVIDETYQDFLYDGAAHYSPCANALQYDGIIHVGTCSKSFGLAGWRVGFIVYPAWASEHMQKIEDTVPTHPSIASQKIALGALQCPPDWVSDRVKELYVCRDALWKEVEWLGTVRTCGAFYFLVPVPMGVSEEDVIDVLATEYSVLVTPGSAFGAPGYLRVSYGSVAPEVCIAAIRRFGEGMRTIAARIKKS